MKIGIEMMRCKKRDYYQKETERFKHRQIKIESRKKKREC